MTGRHQGTAGRLGVWLAALIVLAGWGGSAHAQTMNRTITDPYDPWNAMYRQYIFPREPGVNLTPFDVPAYNARSSAMSYQRYLESGGGGRGLYGPVDTGRPGLGTPYYSAYRQYDEELGRVYTPNPGDDFYDEQADRQLRYFEAMQVDDPARRAELLRELRRDTSQAMQRSRVVGYGGNTAAQDEAAAARERQIRRTSPASRLFRRTPGAQQATPARSSLFRGSSNLYRERPEESEATGDEATEETSRESTSPGAAAGASSSRRP